MTKQPNILLIVVDQMRGDCMSIAGHPDVKTPNIDSLAEKGIYFPKAYCAAPTCIAARAELFTGMKPRKTGRIGYKDGVPWKYEHTLAGELTKAGYYTQCVGKMHVHPLRSMQGFHHIELHDGYLEYYQDVNRPFYENQKYADDYFYWLKSKKGIDFDVGDTGLGGNSYLARPWIYEEELHPTNWVSSRCIDFFRRRDRDMPFFLMASYVRPHAPLDAPQCYFDMYKDMDLQKPVTAHWNNPEQCGNGRIHDDFVAPPDEEMVRQQQIGYYACITHLDHQIGRIMQELSAQGVADNTLIIFTSDHGEMLCDHGLTRKSYPYQGSVHIPMILSGSHLMHPKRINHSLVGLRDILPTCLAAARAPIPENVDGMNMLSDSFSREYIHGEHAFRHMSNHFIVTEKDKYIWYSQTGQEQYFNLEKDPQEQFDLIENPEYSSRIAYLRDILIRQLKGFEDGCSDGEKLIVGQKPLDILPQVLNL